MLGSITPLGERGRGRQWHITVGFLMLGGAVGGACCGFLAGVVGQLLVAPALGSDTRLIAVGAVLVVAAVAELAGVHPPGPRRQVNEDWMYTYREWVYGGGFGLQLGLGFVTVVSTHALYATFLVALLTGSVQTATLIGLVFGLVRTATVLLGRRATSPARAGEVAGGLLRWEGAVKGASMAALLLLALAVSVAAAWGTA
jgi:hypothetical protein